MTGTASSRAAPTGVNSRPTPTSTSFGVRGGIAALDLPPSLVPRLEASSSAVAASAEPLLRRAGVPGRIVQACRTSIATAAFPYGAVQVEAASVGQASRTPDGGLTAPIAVRVVYARANERQIRQSRVACRLNAAGTVVALR
jgi:hypothetical protein